MKLCAPLLVLMVFLLPDLSFAGSSFSVSYDDDGLTPQQRIRSLNREAQNQSSAEERMRAVEEREIENQAPKEKNLPAQEIEQIIDKKNQELLAKIKPDAVKKPEVKPDNSAFGKVGGIGAVGGGGIGSSSAK